MLSSQRIWHTPSSQLVAVTPSQANTCLGIPLLSLATDLPSAGLAGIESARQGSHTSRVSRQVRGISFSMTLWYLVGFANTGSLSLRMQLYSLFSDILSLSLWLCTTVLSLGNTLYNSHTQPYSLKTHYYSTFILLSIQNANLRLILWLRTINIII